MTKSNPSPRTGPSTGMQPVDLKDISKGGSHLHFADQEFAEAPSQDPPLQRSVFDRCDFTNVRLKHLKFVEGAITRSRFIDTYMPKAVFDRVDLTGTHFTRCNLKDVTFDGCKLWYVAFADCELNYANLLENLPRELNLRARLLHNLRMNALGRGDTTTANELLLSEMAARREENLSIVWATDKYFRDKYGFRDRVKASLRLLTDLVDRSVWGYGVSFSTLFRSALVVILVAATVNWSMGGQFHTVTNRDGLVTLSFFEALYVSIVTFTTLGYGDYSPGDTLTRVIACIECLAGGVFLGLLAATAYRRIGR